MPPKHDRNNCHPCDVGFSGISSPPPLFPRFKYVSQHTSACCFLRQPTDYLHWLQLGTPYGSRPPLAVPASLAAAHPPAVSSLCHIDTYYKREKIP